MVKSEPLRIRLESTADVEPSPPAARVWRGRSDDGAEFIAYITLGAGRTGKRYVDARTQRALETRIVSTALIEIPLAGEVET